MDPIQWRVFYPRGKRPDSCTLLQSKSKKGEVKSIDIIQRQARLPDEIDQVTGLAIFYLHNNKDAALFVHYKPDRLCCWRVKDLL